MTSIFQKAITINTIDDEAIKDYINTALMLGGAYGELLDLKHTAKWMNKKQMDNRRAKLMMDIHVLEGKLRVLGGDV